MRVLVTGGAGYIGSHTARRLKASGFQPVIFDNLSVGHAFALVGMDSIVADLADRDALSAALRRVDAVMHFAAFSGVSESVRDPRKYFHNNVQTGLSLLHAVLDAGIRYFILSSTCAVYGPPSRVPIPIDTPRLPINPYGATKLALEHALEAYSAAHGLQYASLRYFNAAGADESGAIGELHRPETHLIPNALLTASGQRSELQIFGSDYPTPDGTCIRDYIHVNDLADAHILALRYLHNGGESAAFNLGTGTGYSVLEVVQAVEAVTGRPLPRRVCPRRAGDPPALIADPSHANKLLQWKPSRNLRDMVSNAWQWMQSPTYLKAQT
ncbi:MAG: UDP-glucose 4-epimerase GalE [Acidobacteria bacterium RIFCSPLOWO2_12_FULL_54_10]|nr:MAG: UDP-glucose 4-epimerase GalE [Acidobacteria bacterium RIFCSPLOWO2_12_FULL_54_10]